MSEKVIDSKIVKLFNIFCYNINTIIDNYCDLNIRFINGKFSIEDKSKLLKKTITVFNGISINDIKKHTMSFGTTGVGKSLLVTNMIFEKEPNYLHLFIFQDFILFLKEDLVNPNEYLITLYNSNDLSHYTASTFYPINYHKFAYLLLRKTTLDSFFDSINEFNFKEYIKIKDLLEY